MQGQIDGFHLGELKVNAVRSGANLGSLGSKQALGLSYNRAYERDLDTENNVRKPHIMKALSYRLTTRI